MAPVLQVYVLAPEAFKVTVPPRHTVAGGTDTIGFGLTVSVVKAILLHPLA
jgi:hypothetical protein